jgi:hypothetical protein
MQIASANCSKSLHKLDHQKKSPIHGWRLGALSVFVFAHAAKSFSCQLIYRCASRRLLSFVDSFTLIELLFEAPWRKHFLSSARTRVDRSSLAVMISDIHSMLGSNEYIGEERRKRIVRRVSQTLSFKKATRKKSDYHSQKK